MLGSLGAIPSLKSAIKDLGQSGVRKLSYDDGNVSPWTT